MPRRRQMRDGNPVYKTPTGTTADSVILEGSDVTSAEAQMYQDPTTGTTQYEVTLQLSEDGAQKFADATERLQGQIISIWMDDTMISAPTVNSVISDGRCSITGDFTAAEASDLANKINAGALPFKLVTTNFSTVSPTLGASALSAMELAGIIGFILVCLIMLIVYRLPGFVAIIALLGQIALCFAAVSGFFPFINSFTMTLPASQVLFSRLAWGLMQMSLHLPVLRKKSIPIKRWTAQFRKVSPTASGLFLTEISPR